MSTRKPKALITGINGFVGSHLADRLLDSGCRVSGFTSDQNMSNIEHILPQIDIYYGDIRSEEELEKILSEVKPDYLYHLAACAFVPDANSNPKRVYEVNVNGTLNLLEVIRRLGLKTKVLVVSSSEAYGPVTLEETVLAENAPFNPSTYYGMTKACADLIARQYASTFNLDVIIVRPFNHIGPRQLDSFVCSSFAKQIVEVEKGLRAPELFVGNLQTSRDFTDVRDIVRGYQMILEQGKTGAVYNIGSGKAVKIGEILESLIAKSRIEGIDIKQDPLRMRAKDVAVVVGESKSLQRDFGWVPEISLEKTLHDLLDYWRGQVANV